MRISDWSSDVCSSDLPLALSSVRVDLCCNAAESAVDITAVCKVDGRTGVEMEALTAATVAALTVYDMCKAVDRGMTICDTRLIPTSGGTSGTYRAPLPPSPRRSNRPETRRGGK